MKRFLNNIPDKMILPFFIVGGLLTGLCVYTIYMSRAYSYISDNPSACINCHIMSPYYQSWSRSSHAHATNCNDCHVPHNNIISKYTFKAIDGLFHSAKFTLKAETQVIRPRNSSSNVIMNNCIRCHLQINTEFVKTGMITYYDTKNGIGKACWDCHKQTPHTHISSLSSSPNAIVPLPESSVPKWMMKNNKK